jgi:hypothetical protein
MERRAEDPSTDAEQRRGEVIVKKRVTRKTKASLARIDQNIEVMYADHFLSLMQVTGKT